MHAQRVQVVQALVLGVFLALVCLSLAPGELPNCRGAVLSCWLVPLCLYVLQY
jgi:hypothetical protein